MKNILIDAGPIIALFNKKDSYHQKMALFLEPLEFQFISTWPVITESLHILSFNVKVQLDLLKWINLNGIRIFDLKQHHLKRIIALTEKYSDIPMDLADASLIIASEELGINKIISIDSDYDYYKNVRNQFLNNIFKKNQVKSHGLTSANGRHTTRL